MKPLTVITGIILGSSASIFLGLAVVVFLFAVVGDGDPRIESQFKPLIQSTLVFMTMTGVSVWSFLGLLKDRWWRWWAQAGLWVAVLVMVLFMRQLVAV